MPAWRKSSVLGCTIAFLLIGAFWPVLGNDFISIDDYPYVVNNTHVLRGLTLDGVRWALTSFDCANWHPLTWLSHMVDIGAFGLQARWHHLTSLLLHLINTLLLFFVLRAMTGATGRSFLVAALFGTHPLHVESVAWIAERKDVLSTFFWMLSVAAYLRFVRRPGGGRFLVVILLFAFGLMAKPMVLTFPLVLLLLDFWPLGRWRLSSPTLATSSHGSGGSSPMALLFEKAPLFALAVASSVVTVVAQAGGGMTRPLAYYPIGVRIANALFAYVGYLQKAFWPLDLAIPYPHHGSAFSTWSVAGAAFVLVAASVIAVRFLRSHPFIAVGWFWYLGTLVPVIGLVQVADQAMADRYTYVPLIGIMIMVLWGLSELGGSRRQSKPISIVAAIMVLTSLGLLTRFQTRYWRDDVTLESHAIEVDPDNYFAQGNLAAALAARGHLAEAVTHYKKAFQIKPFYHLEAYYQLGLALMQLGRDQEAIDQFKSLLMAVPQRFDAHFNLGVLLARNGKAEESLAHYTAALQLRPNSPEALNNVGAALADLGRFAEAIPYYRAALQISPDFQLARTNIEQSMFMLGKSGSAAPAPQVPARR
jgi:Tfp pilus assembly protein PilF